MTLATVLAGLVRMGGSLGGLIEPLKFLDERGRDRAKVAAEIVKAHRELQAYIRSLPASDGYFDRTRDIKASPRTEVETHCVRLSLVHLAWALAESAADRYDLPEGLDADIRNFFTYPVRADAWQELMPFQDKRLVRRVERALSKR